MQLKLDNSLANALRIPTTFEETALSKFTSFNKIDISNSLHSDLTCTMHFQDVKGQELLFHNASRYDPTASYYSSASSELTVIRKFTTFRVHVKCSPCEKV